MAGCSRCGAEISPDARFCPECGAPVAAEPAEERKLATVLFADLVGSTALAGSQDPERARVLLERFYDAMAEEIERAGGTVEKFAGDAQVPHPLRVTAGSNEISGPVEGEQIDRRAPWLPGFPAADLEYARSPDADAEPRERGNRAIEEVARKPVRSDVALRHEDAIIPSARVAGQSGHGRL